MSLEDFEKFQADLVVWKREAGKVAGAAVERSTNRLYQAERQSVKVATGDLRDSITKDTAGRFSGGKYARRVYSEDPAAVFEEYGKEGQPPHPFVGQHIETIFDALEADIANNLPGFPR